MTAPILRVAHLYPRLMNIYGDRGNIMCLRHRTQARGIAFALTELSLGDAFDPAAHDLVFAGGAQDREQRAVADDLLATKAPALRDAVEDGVVLLAVCGAYQLFGRFYRESTGVELPGAAIFDLHTEHPGEGSPASSATSPPTGPQAPQGRRRPPTAARRRLRESRRPHLPRAQRTALCPRPHRPRQQRPRRHRGRRLPQRLRHLHPRQPAPQESRPRRPPHRPRPPSPPRRRPPPPIDDRLETRAHAAAVKLKP